MTTHWTDKWARLGACADGLAEARKYPTMAAWWKATERGDYLLWVIARVLTKPTKSEHRRLILMACDFVDESLHFFEEKYPEDKRPRQAVEAAKNYANEPSEKNKTAAYAAAYAAANAAYAAAYVTANAAANAAYAAANAAAYAAAYAAANAAYAASNAAYAAVYAASNAAAIKKQVSVVRAYFPKPPRRCAK